MWPRACSDHDGEERSVTAANDSATTPARVVIAEDEAIVRLDLKEILLSAGYDVVGETGRVDEAVQLVEEHQPDLAILDVKMPGMDGLRAAREITSRHQAVVLLLTAFSQRDLIEEARDSGGRPTSSSPSSPGSCSQPLPTCWPRPARTGPSRRSTPPTGPRTDRDPLDRRRGEADPDGPGRPPRDGGVRLHPAHGHADAGAAPAYAGPTGRRRHTYPVESAAWRHAKSDLGPLLLLDGMSLAFRACSPAPARRPGRLDRRRHRSWCTGSRPCWCTSSASRSFPRRSSWPSTPPGPPSAPRSSRTARPVGPRPRGCCRPSST